ncbi:hypothetical protein [Sporosarcina sp. BP05]|uniref:hypothetical protein n=1 Tax=Sporosarcina sp. BP05 TaxID=2758726 RepID=UPI001645846B|nr:hypothetical protein [Sporosarcina sp. BP05]
MPELAFEKNAHIERGIGTEKELAYQNLCQFEKNYCESISVDSKGSVIYSIDPVRLAELDNLTENDLKDLEHSTVEFPSYEKLFEAKYKNKFLKSVAAIKPNELEKKLGQGTLDQATKRDRDLRLRYAESIKEVDLDNDGVPDRIDIDDTRSSVQTVADLNILNNTTSKDTSRDHDKKKEKQKDDLDL